MPASVSALTSVSNPAFVEAKRLDRILIVDDSASMRKVFSAYLSNKYICEDASSVMEAFGLLAEREYSLVITDMLMPGLSGIELLRKVIENYPYTAVIIISGINQPQRALDAVRLGAFDYLIKPCEMEVLGMTVERAIERRTLLLNARQYKLDLEARNNELARSNAEREKLQSQIVQNEKMASLGQLVAGIAHELNNPVGFIYGNIDILKQTLGDLRELLDFYNAAPLTAEIKRKAEEVKQKIHYDLLIEDLDVMIGDFREGAERIRDIVQNLRVFSRLDDDGFTKTDINEGIDSSLRLLSRYYRSDKIQLIRDYEKLPLVDTFSGQLNQVWMNLLVNAAQAVEEKGGRVRVATRLVDNSVIVEISDTGCGIPPEILNKIFDPFYTTKPVGEGTGLGLSISFSIVERHHGSIGVKSLVGRGTTFTVKIPVKYQPDEEEETLPKTEVAKAAEIFG